MLRRVACALDIDGVLVKGNKPIKGALEAIQTLYHHQIPFVCLTNGGGVLEKVKAEKLSHILTKDTMKPTTELIPANRMILAHTPMQRLALDYEHDDVLIVGGGDEQSLMEVVKAYGFKNAIHVSDYVLENPSIYPIFPTKKNAELETDEEFLNRLERERPHTHHDFKAILVLYDSDHVGRDCQVMIDVLRSCGRPGYDLHVPTDDKKQHVRLYMSHQDFLYASNFAWPRFGQGFLKMTLQHIYHNLTGRNLEINMFGKPYPGTYRFCEKRLQEIAGQMGHSESLSTFYGVGDNPLSDIQGANNAGELWKSVLVRTGVFQGESNDTDNPADIVQTDVLEFVHSIIEQQQNIDH